MRRLRIPRAISWLTVAAVLAIGTSASAHSRIEEAANHGWLGLAAVTCSTVYAPIKVFIGGSGLIVGGFAWAVTGGAPEPALPILERTLGGDWLVTPEHLDGERRFSVLGPTHPRPVARR